MWIIDPLVNIYLSFLFRIEETLLKDNDFAYTKDHVHTILTKSFQRSPFLTKDLSYFLAKKLGIEEEQIETWYKNHRKYIYRITPEVSWRGKLTLIFTDSVIIYFAYMYTHVYILKHITVCMYMCINICLNICTYRDSILLAVKIILRKKKGKCDPPTFCAPEIFPHQYLENAKYKAHRKVEFSVIFILLMMRTTSDDLAIFTGHIYVY